MKIALALVLFLSTNAISKMVEEETVTTTIEQHVVCDLCGKNAYVFDKFKKKAKAVIRFDLGREYDLCSECVRPILDKVMAQKD